MKEYLETMPNGEYRYQKDEGISIGGDWIEIPAGAEFLTKCTDPDDKNWFLFWKSDQKFCVGWDKEWVNCDYGLSDYLKDWSLAARVLWSRFTQPEELPFIDETTYLTQGANGDHLKASIGEINNAEKIVSCDSFNLLPDFEFDTPITCGPMESDGGSSGYYFTKLPKHMIDQIVATGGIEIKDIARYVYDNNADAFNIIKAQKRIIEAKKGGGKKGASMQYDANKIVYFGNEQLNALNADK